MIYRLYKTLGSDIANGAMTIDASPQISFIFDPANTNYQQFKTDVASGVPLEDPDGNVMTQDEVNAFLETIP